jgi:glycosyltransferase involved in cell wall biosynthesis
VRLAVFTDQFPNRVSTFFARDIRALLNRGIEIEIFPIRPLDPELWTFVPDMLSERVLPRERVHHIPLRACARAGNWRALGQVSRFARDAVAIARASLSSGPGPVAKSVYAALKGWGWAQEPWARGFDHVLAYWGNYAATSAYVFHRLTDPRVPFSMIIHSGDLYEAPAFLAEKMLYADNIFLVCEFNRQYISRHFPRQFPRLAGKIGIHYLGLNLEEMPFTPLPRPAGTVLAVGRFEELKGFHILLRAIGALRDRGIRVELQLIGAGGWDTKLKALAADLQIAGQVTFSGWLTPDRVLEAMRQATILVHPSITPDAMPTVIKEALAVGTPVIASDLAGIPEILDRGRCGSLVPPGNVCALADAISMLLEDGARRQEFARAGREHVERVFDLWRNGQRLAHHLRSTRRRNGAREAEAVVQ